MMTMLLLLLLLYGLWLAAKNNEKKKLTFSSPNHSLVLYVGLDVCSSILVSNSQYGSW